MLTVATSLLFWTVAVHAFAVGETTQGLVFACLAPVSVLNHAACGCRFAGLRFKRATALLQVADQSLIGCAVANGVARVAYFTIVAPRPLSWVVPIVFLPCLWWIHHVYAVARLSFLPGDAWKPWHASLHLVTIVGHHLIFWALR